MNRINVITAVDVNNKVTGVEVVDDLNHVVSNGDQFEFNFYNDINGGKLDLDDLRIIKISEYDRSKYKLTDFLDDNYTYRIDSDDIHGYSIAIATGDPEGPVSSLVTFAIED